MTKVQVLNCTIYEMASREFIPFCEDNGDYYCFAPDGHVELWSHDGLRGGSWPDLAHWIQEVWIEDFQEMQDV